MKKTLIYSLPMKKPDQMVYQNGLFKTEISSDAFFYPIHAYLAKHMTPEDDYKIIFIVKRNGFGGEIEAERICREELEQINAKIGAKIEIKTIATDFDEQKTVHDMFFSALIDEIEDESTIIWDSTFGSKDVPLIIFAALNFAEKFLDCEVEHIFYSQGYYQGKDLVRTKLVTMDSLFSLISLVNNVDCDSPEKARNLVKLLTSL